MPITRRRHDAHASSGVEDSPTPSALVKVRERSGEYRLVSVARAKVRPQPLTRGLPEATGHVRATAVSAPAPSTTLPSMTAVSPARVDHVHRDAPSRRSTADAFGATHVVGGASKLSSPSPSNDEPPSCPVFTSEEDASSYVAPYGIEEDDVDPELVELLRQLEGTGQPSKAVRFTPAPMEAVKAPVSGLRASVATHDEPPVSSGLQRPAEEALPAREELASSNVPDVAPRSAAAATVDPRPGIVAFAGYGLVPEKLSELPAYALHVLARRQILRSGLEVARKRRQQDVELYRAALAAADDAAVYKGLVLLVVLACAVLGVIGGAFALIA